MNTTQVKTGCKHVNLYSYYTILGNKAVIGHLKETQ